MYNNQETTTANRFDQVQILDLLDRLESAKKVLDRTGDIEDTIEKLNTLDLYMRRFGSLKDLTTHLRFIEKKMYLLKEYLSVTEAADYLNISPSQIYKMTSKHEVPVYKPNGKILFIRRDDLNHWVNKNKVMSKDELEEFATAHLQSLATANNRRRAWR